MALVAITARPILSLCHLSTDEQPGRLQTTCQKQSLFSRPIRRPWYRRSARTGLAHVEAPPASANPRPFPAPRSSPPNNFSTPAPATHCATRAPANTRPAAQESERPPLKRGTSAFPPAPPGAQRHAPRTLALLPPPPPPHPHHPRRHALLPQFPVPSARCLPLIPPTAPPTPAAPPSPARCRSPRGPCSIPPPGSRPPRPPSMRRRR